MINLASLLVPGSVWKKIALGLAAVILVAVLTGLAAWRGYKAGYHAADLERQAEVADIEAAYSRAQAEAEAEARKLYEQAVTHGHAVERQLLAAQKTIDRQSRELTNQRIIHASKDVAAADGSCRFGPSWVRSYNEALGLGDGGGSDPGDLADAPGDAGAAPAADAGVLRGVETVTPEDILAHARDYGQYTRIMAARLAALIALLKGRNGGEVVP